MVENLLTCPLCGSENLHPGIPRLIGKYEESGADYHIILPFTCESSCAGIVDIYHYKGTTVYDVSKM